MSKLIRYQMILEYDGSDFYGFQRLTKLPSVQLTVEKALKNMTSQEILTFVSGRTDKGVHAKGQVLHFDTLIDLNSNTWVDGLNRRLPASVKVLKIKKVNFDFHARHSAKSKIYEYVISKEPSSAFNSRYEVYQPNLKVELIKEGAKLFKGIHDFKAFSINIKDKPTIKEIYSVKVIETKTHIKIRFHGNSFLRYMIRRMVGLLIEIGLNKKTLEDINKALNHNEKNIANKTAPAKGLYLIKIFY